MYNEMRDIATLDPIFYCSIIDDVADQSVFALPHFVSRTKQDGAQCLNIWSVRLMAHEKPDKLFFIQ